ncbi:hypothetical protein IG631_09546 [Alternaria alternata]|nr:hypothetical protein IG631_09546 [Alternaria alternata]
MRVVQLYVKPDGGRVQCCGGGAWRVEQSRTPATLGFANASSFASSVASTLMPAITFAVSSTARRDRPGHRCGI